jgi:hypothetical protein
MSDEAKRGVDLTSRIMNTVAGESATSIALACATILVAGSPNKQAALELVSTIWDRAEKGHIFEDPRN